MTARHAAAEELLPAGTALAVGDPAPPTTAHKAVAGLWYGAGPVLLGAVLEVLFSADVLFPDASPPVKSGIATALILLGPVASYFGVKRTPNLLLQPVVLQPVVVDVADPPGPPSV